MAEEEEEEEEEAGAAEASCSSPNAIRSGFNCIHCNYKPRLPCVLLVTASLGQAWPLENTISPPGLHVLHGFRGLLPGRIGVPGTRAVAFGGFETGVFRARGFEGFRLLVFCGMGKNLCSWRR